MKELLLPRILGIAIHNWTKWIHLTALHEKAFADLPWEPGVYTIATGKEIRRVNGIDRDFGQDHTPLQIIGLGH